MKGKHQSKNIFARLVEGWRKTAMDPRMPYADCAFKAPDWLR